MKLNLPERLRAALQPARRFSRYASTIPVAVLLAAVPHPAAGQGPLPPDSAVRALLDARAALATNSGAVAGLIDANGQRVVAAGTVNGAGTPAPTAKHLFEIGSLTKAFTGTLLADAVLRDRVTLETPVATLLPDSVGVPRRGDRQITLLDLATQSSGLPRLPGNLSPANPRNPYAGYDAAHLYEFLSSYTLPRDPGAEYEYSNLGMGLLGFALAREAGMSYEQLVQGRIAGPLDMVDTRITLSASERERLAPGHDVGGDTTANWDLDALAGAGALRSTVSDLLHFLAAAMQPDSTTAVGRALRLAEQPRRPAGSPNMRIGLGWHVRAVDGDTIVWHNGATGGYHSFLGFDRARGVGLVILSNSAVPYDDVALHLLDPSVPISPPAVPPRRTAVPLTEAQLAPYVGRYQLTPAAVITVTREGTQLYAQLTGQQRVPIYAERDGRFFFRVVDAVLDFERDGEGDVVAVVLHQNGQDARAPRLP